jgi:tRNA(fMet)-specific endonuclease VapC
MTEAILDTDILSEIVKARNVNVAARVREYIAEHKRFTFSAISVAEIVRGYRRISNQQKLDAISEFIDRNEILGIGKEEAKLAGRITAELEIKGLTIGHMDPFIAATAIIHKLPLVTGNTRHFNRIIELGYPLELQNWRDALP